MAGMLDILESVKQIINRWVNTQIPITSNVSSGDTIIEVRNSQRFLKGDEVMIRSSTNAELPQNYIEEIIDDTHIKLVNPVLYSRDISESVILQKTYDTQVLNGIYFGEPENVPTFPAICIKATTTDSDWFTIDSTKEIYNIDVNVYTKAATQEKGYKAHIRLAENIRYGLKRNIYPLVGPYKTTTVIADIVPGDSFIKIADSSILFAGERINIEGEYTRCETFVNKIIDINTIRISPAALCSFFAASEHPVVIAPERYIFNSWPKNTTYGEVYKGTLLKAARINWFAWEEVIWTVPPDEANLR